MPTVLQGLKVLSLTYRTATNKLWRNQFHSKIAFHNPSFLSDTAYPMQFIVLLRGLFWKRSPLPLYRRCYSNHSI